MQMRGRSLLQGELSTPSLSRGQLFACCQSSVGVTILSAPLRIGLTEIIIGRLPVAKFACYLTHALYIAALVCRSINVSRLGLVVKALGWVGKRTDPGSTLRFGPPFSSQIIVVYGQSRGFALQN